MSLLLGEELRRRLVLTDINRHVRYNWRLWPLLPRALLGMGLPHAFILILVVREGFHRSSQHFGNRFKHCLGLRILNTSNIRSALLLGLFEQLSNIPAALKIAYGFLSYYTPIPLSTLEKFQ